MASDTALLIEPAPLHAGVLMCAHRKAARAAAPAFAPAFPVAPAKPEAPKPEASQLEAPQPTVLAADMPATDIAQPSAARRVRWKPRPTGSRVVFGSHHGRQDFLDALARTGDPALAADALGLSLMRLCRHRAADADFAADWHAAIGFAWERVENRVLAHLLDGANAALDSKVVLAMIARRDPGAAAVKRLAHGPAESSSVARLRAELRALAGPNQPPKR